MGAGMRIPGESVTAAVRAKSILAAFEAVGVLLIALGPHRQ